MNPTQLITWAMISWYPLSCMTYTKAPSLWDSPNSKGRHSMETYNLDILWVSASAPFGCWRKPLMTIGQGTYLWVQQNIISNNSLIFVFEGGTSCVWFYPRYLRYLLSGTWPSSQCMMWALSWHEICWPVSQVLCQHFSSRSCIQSRLSSLPDLSTFAKSILFSITKKIHWSSLEPSSLTNFSIWVCDWKLCY